MRLRRIDRSGKGWLTGPWEGDAVVPVAVGYADVGVDDPHVHDQMYEIYLVAGGTSTAVVNGERVALAAGDALVVEPGDHHTFVASSDDYFHFVVQAPWVAGDKRASRRDRLAAEARALDADPADRAEMRAVMDTMRSLRPAD